MGEGSFGVVLKCVNKETNEVVAIKRLKEKMNWDKATNLREVKALKKLNNHDNVIKIKEMTLKQEVLSIVYECCDANLL
jgi:serine/threonine protein kinase